jgi:hypothetical protein
LHNPELIGLPVGPVTRLGAGFPADREVFLDPPDTDRIRSGLVALLERMPEVRREEYLASFMFDEVVIAQAALLKERRAVPALRRIARFDPEAYPRGTPFARDRTWTVAYAIDALATIVGDEALPEITRGVRLRHLAKSVTLDNPDPKRLGVVRAFSVRALDHCSWELAKPLYLEACKDPDDELRAAAREAFDERRASEEG